MSTQVTVMGEVGPIVLGDRHAKLDGAQAWGSFLFVSYLFGHLVFLLGSWLDEFYDWARRHSPKEQIASPPGSVAALEPPVRNRATESTVMASMRRTT